MEPGDPADAARGVTRVAETNATDLIGRLGRGTRFDCLVLDLPRYTEETATASLRTRARIVSFGVPLASTFGDVVVNVAEAGDPERSRESVGGASVFRGAEYVFLRPDVLSARGRHPFDRHDRRDRERGGAVALAVFGGTDPSALVLEVIEGIGGSETELLAVCDRRHPAHGEARRLAARHSNVRVESSFRGARNFLARGDILITAPGNLLFEGACHGIPLICFCQNAKQFGDFSRYANVHERSRVSDVRELVAERLSGARANDERLHCERVGRGAPWLIDTLLNTRTSRRTSQESMTRC